MPININTYCRVNRNGSININTDPTFGFTTTTSTTTTTTTINPADYACVSGAPDPTANGTYVYFGDITIQDVTRRQYGKITSDGWFISLISSPPIPIPGPQYAIYFEENFVYLNNTKPVPTNPWEGSWSDGVVVTIGPC